MKRICPECGNKRKRLMRYVELWGEDNPNPQHFGYKCIICGHFWEVYIVNTEPL